MRHRIAGVIAAACVFLADQISKWIVTHPLDLEARGAIHVLPIFDLRWVENYGVSLGLLTADSDLGRWLLVLMTGTIATVVAVWMWRERKRADAVALGLVLGGAIGNIVDRVRFGHVVDFADLHFGDWHPFLVFNVADAAISIGVVLLVLRALFVREERPSEDVHA
jgi:signal peptidase II